LNNKTDVNINWSAWTFEKASKECHLPTQETHNDCGVFVCMYALCIVLGGEFLFSQADISQLRIQMAYEILDNHIHMFNRIRFIDSVPFCQQGQIVTQEALEDYIEEKEMSAGHGEKGITMKLRRRSQLKKRQPYTPPSSSVIKPSGQLKQGKKRKRDDDSGQVRKSPKTSGNIPGKPSATEENTYRYEISPDEVKQRVAAMEHYLRSIAETKTIGGCTVASPGAPPSLVVA